MNPNYLDFEQPIAELEAKIEELQLIGEENDKINIADELIHLRDQKKLDVYAHVLHSGGDYELLVICPKKCFAKAAEALRRIGTHLTIIGKVTKEQDISLTYDGKKELLPDHGYEHFSKK